MSLLFNFICIFSVCKFSFKCCHSKTVPAILTKYEGITLEEN